MVDAAEGLRPNPTPQPDDTSAQSITPENICGPSSREEIQVTEQSQTIAVDSGDEDPSTTQRLTADDELAAPHSLPSEGQSQQPSSLQPIDHTIHVLEPDNSDPSSSAPPDKHQVPKRYQRAEAIFKEYNIDFNETDWTRQSKVQNERVHKAPRMRVRWTCHECNTSFGHDRTCVECAHHRCRKCPRYPPRKRKQRTSRSAAENPTVEEEARGCLCHECQTAFDLSELECSNCRHQMCERCLQESGTTAEQFLTQGVAA